MTKTIEVPRFLQHLRRDPRGYPHPFLMVDDSIVTMDPKKQLRCIREKLCMICGRKLDNKKWFIGGHRTAVNRVVVDPAMHEDCARYSMKVCPFLSNQEMKYRKKYGEGTTLIAGLSEKRAETQCLMRTNGSRPIIFNGQLMILCNRWEVIEHWADGKIVAAPPGLSLAELKMRPGALDAGGELAHLYRQASLS